MHASPLRTREDKSLGGGRGKGRPARPQGELEAFQGPGLRQEGPGPERGQHGPRARGSHCLPGMSAPFRSPTTEQGSVEPAPPTRDSPLAPPTPGWGLGLPGLPAPPGCRPSQQPWVLDGRGLDPPPPPPLVAQHGVGLAALAPATRHWSRGSWEAPTGETDRSPAAPRLWLPTPRAEEPQGSSLPHEASPPLSKLQRPPRTSRGCGCCQGPQVLPQVRTHAGQAPRWERCERGPPSPEPAAGQQRGHSPLCRAEAPAFRARGAWPRSGPRRPRARPRPRLPRPLPARCLQTGAVRPLQTRPSGSSSSRGLQEPRPGPAQLSRVPHAGLRAGVRARLPVQDASGRTPSLMGQRAGPRGVLRLQPDRLWTLPLCGGGAAHTALSVRTRLPLPGPSESLWSRGQTILGLKCNVWFELGPSSCCPRRTAGLGRPALREHRARKGGRRWEQPRGPGLQWGWGTAPAPAPPGPSALWCTRLAALGLQPAACSFGEGGREPQRCPSSERPERVCHLLQMSRRHWLHPRAGLSAVPVLRGGVATGRAWVSPGGGAPTWKQLQRRANGRLMGPVLLGSEAPALARPR